MAPFKKSPILLVLMTMVVATLKGGEALFAKRTVQIINNVAPPQDLTLHCKSKDDDLGEHTIKGGEDYQFRFRPNIVTKITLFFCSFRWPSDMSLHYFDIFVQDRDEKLCIWCSWKIREDGPCRYDPDAHQIGECFHWNPKPQSTTQLPLAASNTNTTSTSNMSPFSD